MSQDRILKEAGWLRTWLDRIKDRRVRDKVANYINKDPGMKRQARKVIKAFDKWEATLDDAEDFANYLINKEKK